MHQLRRSCTACVALMAFAVPAHAQSVAVAGTQFSSAQIQFGSGSVQFETDATPTPAPKMTDEPVVKLQSLDKVTARTMTFEVKVGTTVKFGPIYIKVQACRKAPPIAAPESAAFLQIWEVTKKDESKWIYSGWMFASSPALSAMDHPIYDVWVLDCLERKSTDPEPKKEEKKAEAPKKDSVKAEVNPTTPKEGDVKDGVVTGAAAEPPKEAPPVGTEDAPEDDAPKVEMPTVTLPGEEPQ
ncbi:MAG: hypothetical protein JWO78_1791 [Micavibrio sp.]|nr:hypothetical protein [Micavibrio sp.]